MPSEPGNSVSLGFNPSEKAWIAGHFPAGATIFAEGEPGTVAYILLRGDVTISSGLELRSSAL
jgi:CRP-like cAMP-binding protein